MKSEFPIRINKYLTLAGYTTRRGADSLISEKRVFVNGTIAKLGQKIEGHDRVEIKDLNKKTHRYILYYKPRDIVTHSPSENEVSIETRIQKDHNMHGVFPVGRLDKKSEGLILLTNDGRIPDKLLNPEIGHERTYEVIVDKRVTQTFMNALSRGVQIEEYRTKTAHAEKNKKNEYAFTITLTEGKKHQIRRMCARFGYRVLELKRTRIHILELKKLIPGAFYELKPKEIYTFMESLGLPF